MAVVAMNAAADPDRLGMLPKRNGITVDERLTCWRWLVPACS